MRYDLNDVYLHLGQVEEVIHDTKVSKKKKNKKKKKKLAHLTIYIKTFALYILVSWTFVKQIR